ncbi:glycoside hydrolase family 3 N-terminal domain-containing protein [Patescibacteria group bacterium]
MLKFFKIILFFFLAIVIVFIIYKTIFPREIISFPKEVVLNEPEKTLNKLSLEQKIGQLFIIGFEGKEVTPELESLIKTLHPGGILLLGRNIDNPKQLKNLIEKLQEISSNDVGFSLFVAIDQEGGEVSRVEWVEKTPQSEIKDSKQAYQVGLERGKELKELGINLNLAPVLDFSNPDDFIFNRSFKKNPKESGILAEALISGQKAAGILTAVKHFPGYGGISFNPERQELPVLLKTPEISQFKKIIQTEPEMIMAANVVYSEIDKELPFGLSFDGIQFLKKELGDNFLIISDDLSSPVLEREFSLEKTVILAYKAGVNLLIVAGFDNFEDPVSVFNFLFKAIKKGEISEERINLSVLKIIQLKQKLLE